MRSTLSLALLLSCLLAAPLHAEDKATSPAPAPATHVAVTGRYEVIGTHRVLTLWGTPRERGFAQGYLLGEQVVAGIAHDFERIMKPFLPMYEALVKTTVVPKFNFTERETAELEGLFEGLKARLPKEKLRIEALDRAFELVDLKALNTFGDWYGLGCSSLAVWGELTADGQPLVGRNFDFPAFDLVLAHQYIAVRAAEDGAQGSVGVSYPGCIGTLTGMNAAGVFVAIHDVRIKPDMKKALRPNVPRLLAVRRILETAKGAGACAQARDLVRRWPTLYGNNLMVVAPRSGEGAPCAAVLEYDCREDLDGGCTMRLTDGVLERKPTDLPLACLACTNHHRDRAHPNGKGDGFSRWRYETLSSLGMRAKPSRPLGVIDVFALMGRAAFPRDGSAQQRSESLRGKKRNHGTLHQVVGETGKRILHVKLGALNTHIRNVWPRTYDVGALLKAIQGKGSK